jgi:hypothetical protein
MTTPGTLDPTEPHPAAHGAREWIASLSASELCRWQESFASLALDGNRLAEVCSETLRRLMHGEPVSDRYVLGLYVTMRRGLDDE